MITLIGAISLTLLPSAPAQNSVAVEGKILDTTTKKPIGAFTVKAYPTATPSTSPNPQTSNKPLAQTLTRADGTYSLPIPTTLQTVVLKFEKLSYFSVPPQELVQVTPPKTTVPDVAAMNYRRGQTLSTYDLLDAFSLREESFQMITNNLPPSEREKARKKSVEFDLNSLRETGVDSATLNIVKKKLIDDRSN